MSKKLGAMALLLVLFSVDAVKANGNATFIDFAGLSNPELRSLQIKITYGGPQDNLTPSLLFYESTAKPDPEVFRPFKARTFNYLNDQFISYIPTAKSELANFLVDAIRIPSVKSGQPDKDKPYLSFSISRTKGNRTRVFETFLGEHQATTLFHMLVRTMASSERVQEAIRTMGRNLDILP